MIFSIKMSMMIRVRNLFDDEINDSRKSSRNLKTREILNSIDDFRIDVTIDFEFFSMNDELNDEFRVVSNVVR